MSQLLIPVYRGEVDYLKDSDEELEKFASGVLGKNSNPANYRDPFSRDYCYPEFIQWQVNEKLKQGYVAVGMDVNCWVMTKRENTIP